MHRLLWIRLYTEACKATHMPVPRCTHANTPVIQEITCVHPDSNRHTVLSAHTASVRSWRTLSRAHPVTSHRHTYTHTYSDTCDTEEEMPQNQPQGFPAVVILQHLHEGQSLGTKSFHQSLSPLLPPPPGYYWTDKDLYHL